MVRDDAGTRDIRFHSFGTFVARFRTRDSIFGTCYHPRMRSDSAKGQGGKSIRRVEWFFGG